MADVQIMATGLGFPEGPVAMPDGSVILTEIRNRRVTRIAADGTVSLLSDTGGGPNGLAIAPDPDGVTLWVISDDNFARFQRTLLLELHWRVPPRRAAER